MQYRRGERQIDEKKGKRTGKEKRGVGASLTELKQHNIIRRDPKFTEGKEQKDKLGKEERRQEGKVVTLATENNVVSCHVFYHCGSSCP